MEFEFDHLARIVERYRRRGFASIHRPEDCYNDPQDTMISYFLQDQDVDHDDLVQLISRGFGLHQGETPKEPIPMDLAMFMNHEKDMAGLGAAMNEYSDAFAVGNGDKLLLARPEVRTYTFPDGREIEYIHLTNEQSANFPISWEAFFQPDPNTAFIRNIGYKMFIAFVDAIKDREEFKPYEAHFDDFSYTTLGIMLAHEKHHADLPLDGSIEVELEVEQRSFAYLQDRGIKQNAYALFHKLRRKENNLSDVVLKSNLLL
jgi:hypothetical protein